MHGATVPAPPLAPGLHVVATPIGNLRDVTLRALEALAGADLILAEDTRVTRRLLDRYAIRAPMKRHDAHSEHAAVPALLERLGRGAAVALVSDAGTPLLSDPGARLAAAVAAAGLPLFALPGPCAALAALVVSGVPAERFWFEGFLPAKGGERRRRVRDLAAVPGALVLYEAPHRVAACLADLAAVLGPREAAAARELTKRHEEVARGPLPDLAARFAGAEPRGEFVIVVAGPAAGAPEPAGPEALDLALRAALAAHSARDAATVVAQALGVPRREAYARAVALAGGEGGGGKGAGVKGRAGGPDEGAGGA